MPRKNHKGGNPSHRKVQKEGRNKRQQKKQKKGVRPS